MNSNYENNGYLVFKSAFGASEIQKLRAVLVEFHQAWIQENSKLYAERAINSAYLTAKKYLTDSEREVLFQFIGSAKMMDVVTSILSNATFMNTQLFFDPVNQFQRNYWHRDTQYHMSVDQQKEALQGPNVVHFRIPMVDEPGVELIPGTHRRWDSDEELDVRLEQNGRKNYEDLPAGVRVALNAGDLLVFSANMIHRGIYGMDRMALDILFCDPDPEPMKFVDADCLPDAEIMERIENASAFERTIKIKANGTAAHATNE